MDSDQAHALVAYMWKKYNKLEDITWLCGSAATGHLTNDSTAVYNIINIHETAIIGDGNGLKITKKGKLDVKIEQSNGSTCNLTFDVKEAPEVAHQLLSLKMLMQEGWKIMTVWSNNQIKGTIILQHDKKF